MNIKSQHNKQDVLFALSLTDKALNDLFEKRRILKATAPPENYKKAVTECIISAESGKVLCHIFELLPRNDDLSDQSTEESIEAVNKIINEIISK